MLGDLFFLAGDFAFLPIALLDLCDGESRVVTRVEGDGFVVDIMTVAVGIESERTLTADFFRSSEYRNLLNYAVALRGPLDAPGTVKRGEREQAVTTLAQGLDWLVGESKRGLNLQRYKGLDEMNPDQLWETTMDPSTRRLLQVKVEDGVTADEIFTTLMGDQVEPRRDFIETNALAVANLDA